MGSIVLMMMVGAGRDAEARKAVESAQGFFDRLHVLFWPGQPWDLSLENGATSAGYEGASFGEARTKLLQTAQQRHPDASHFLMLDSDESLHGDPEKFRAEIQQIDRLGNGWIERQDRLYAQPRVFGAGNLGYWAGATHEAFCTSIQGVHLESVRWDEAPKTAEQLKAKALRDVEILSEEFNSTHEISARSWHYYAESLAILERSEAVSAFGAAVVQASAEGAPGGAWSAYRLAGLPGWQDHEWLTQTLAIGMSCDPTAAEPIVAMARAMLKTGDHARALAHALHAIDVGNVIGRGYRAPPRKGFVDHRCWFDEPFEIAAAACAHLGAKAQESRYLQEAQVAKRMRLRHTLRLVTP